MIVHGLSRGAMVFNGDNERVEGGAEAIVLHGVCIHTCTHERRGGEGKENRIKLKYI